MLTAEYVSVGPVEEVASAEVATALDTDEDTTGAKEDDFCSPGRVVGAAVLLSTSDGTDVWIVKLASLLVLAYDGAAEVAAAAEEDLCEWP